MMELAGKLKMQQLQGILADKWRPYMENLDTMYTDATCYESEMRYPTDTKLLWEGIEKSYATMCELSGRLGIHRPRTKFLDVQKANLHIGNSASTAGARRGRLHAGCLTCSARY